MRSDLDNLNVGAGICHSGAPENNLLVKINELKKSHKWANIRQLLLHFLVSYIKRTGEYLVSLK